MPRSIIRHGIVVAAFVASALAFPFLPGTLPEHWGVPVGPGVWIARGCLAFFLPVAAVVVGALFQRLALADPLRANYERFRPTFTLVINAAVVCIVGLHATLLVTLLVGMQPWTGYLPPLLIGLALICVGNVMPRVRPNATIGVRTPWTNADSQVWAATHRVAGYVLVTFGVMVIAATFVAKPWLGWFLGVGLGVVAALLAAISFLISRNPIDSGGAR